VSDKTFDIMRLPALFTDLWLTILKALLRRFEALHPQFKKEKYSTSTWVEFQIVVYLRKK